MDTPRNTADHRPIDLDGLRLGGFEGRSVAVLGLARTGIALARFLVDQGARVTVYDRRPGSELADAVTEVGDRSVRLLLGPQVDPAEALEGQELVCTSPSVSSSFPTTEPRLQAALAELERDGHVPVVSEVDLFLRLCPALTIGVTGTKGKTTTSSLIAAVLAGGEYPVLLGGNIGTPLVEQLPEISVRHRVVVELSELQLPTLSRGTRVAVYTHVTSDHLDRHLSVERYRAVKQRLAELVPADGALILNADDPVSDGYSQLAPSSSTVIRYRRSSPGLGELGVEDGWIVARDVLPASYGPKESAATKAEGVAARIMPIEESRLPGVHNVSNVLAAVAVGIHLGVASEAIRSAVRAFQGVEHRLELVAEVDGVRYVNDSQGTQPDAVIAALRSFSPPLVLIAGGRAKDLPIVELARVAAERASAAVLIGESGPDLERAFVAAGLRHTERAESLEAAVVRADAICRRTLAGGAARPGTVLLSPAAASFDMFADYAARGRAFKSAVSALAATRSEGGSP